MPERRPVNEASYEPGKWLGTAPRAWAGEAATEYLTDVRERDPIYLREGLGHPGLLQRVMNRVLVDNAILGPWIYVGSRMQLLAASSNGDELTARARVAGNYDKKGHRFVELDALVVAQWPGAARPLPAHCDLPAARAGGGVGSVVIPRESGGPSTPRASRINHPRSGILGRPVKPGDDSCVFGER